MFDKEIVETSYHPNKGNYISEVYFEFEKGGAVVFSRKKDGKITYIVKTLIRGGFHRNKQEPQDIKLVPYCTIPFYWISRKKYFS
jgi:hypothetical protein